MAGFKQIIATIIALVLSLVTMLGVNVNEGAKEPAMPVEGSTVEYVQYYNQLIAATKAKKFVKISKTDSFSAEQGITIGNLSDESGTVFLAAIEGLKCDNKAIITNDLFCKGKGVQTDILMDAVVASSTLDSRGVFSANVEPSGTDFILTITLKAELDSADNPSVYNAQCVFVPFAGAFDSTGFPVSKTMLYSATTITALVGADGVLKTLTTNVDYTGSLKLDRVNGGSSTTAVYSGTALSTVSFGYNF